MADNIPAAPAVSGVGALAPETHKGWCQSFYVEGDGKPFPCNCAPAARAPEEAETPRSTLTRLREIARDVEQGRRAYDEATHGVGGLAPRISARIAEAVRLMQSLPADEEASS